MILYRITTSNDSFLSKLWEEGWILSCISEGKMYFWKEEKKPVKSRALTNESNKWIAYLKMQRENIDKWIDLHIPDFVTNEKEWNKFINYWTQKNSEDSKMHAEKQKTFDIRARWANWDKDKPKTTNKANSIW